MCFQKPALSCCWDIPDGTFPTDDWWREECIRGENGSCLQNSTSSSEGERYLTVSHLSNRLMCSKCFARSRLLYGINCAAKELWLFSLSLFQNHYTLWSEWGFCLSTVFLLFWFLCRQRPELKHEADILNTWTA